MFELIKRVFLRRRCVVTLSNGCVVRWLRPRKITIEDYRAMVHGWMVAANNTIKLGDDKHRVVVNSNDIMSVDIR